MAKSLPPASAHQAGWRSYRAGKSGDRLNRSYSHVSARTGGSVCGRLAWVGQTRQRWIAVLAIAFAVVSGAAAVAGATAVLRSAEPPTSKGSWGPDLFAPHPVWRPTAEGATGAFTWRYEQTTDGACWRLFLEEGIERTAAPRQVDRRADCVAPLDDPGAEAARLAQRVVLRANASPP